MGYRRARAASSRETGAPDKRQLSISSDAYVTLQGTKFDLMKRTPKSRPCTKETVAAIDNAVRPTIHEMQTAEWKALYKRFRSILGAIMHIVKFTCPQVMFAVSVASAYMSCPCKVATGEMFKNTLQYSKKQTKT